MIRYDWKKMVKATKGSSKGILAIIHILTYSMPPRNYYDPVYKYWGKDWAGMSFLINPQTIFEKRPEFSDKEWAEYIGVASYRNINSYYKSKKTTLDLNHIPMGEDIIKQNRLLKIENDTVHFRFEEII